MDGHRTTSDRQATRILVADDHEILRKGLRKLLDDTPDLLVVGEVADGRTAISLAGQLAPDVIVMDVQMPALNGIEATRKITESVPGIKVVALSMHSDPQFIGRMLQAGAKAYVLKENAFEELVRAIHVVMSDQVYVHPELAERLGDGHAGSSVNGNGKGSPFDRLTGREREVLQLLAEGRAMKEIAADLSISVKTVETHRRHMMDKLDLFSVAELTKYAVREGLTSS